MRVVSPRSAECGRDGVVGDRSGGYILVSIPGSADPVRLDERDVIPIRKTKTR